MPHLHIPSYILEPGFPLGQETMTLSTGADCSLS